MNKIPGLICASYLFFCALCFAPSKVAASEADASIVCPCQADYEETMSFFKQKAGEFVESCNLHSIEEDDNQAVIVTAVAKDKTNDNLFITGALLVSEFHSCNSMVFSDDHNQTEERLIKQALPLLAIEDEHGNKISSTTVGTRKRFIAKDPSKVKIQQRKPQDYPPADMIKLTEPQTNLLNAQLDACEAYLKELCPPLE